MSKSRIEERFRQLKAVIITGGSSGIGHCLIQAIFNVNEKILFCNISRNKPVNLSSKLNLHHFPCDLARPGAAATVWPQIMETLADAGVIADMPHAGNDSSSQALEPKVASRTDRNSAILLINNSGFGLYGEFSKESRQETIDMLHVNVLSLVELTALALPLLKQAGAASGIINIASIASFQPTPFMATYGASKVFVRNWSLAVGEELREEELSVLAVCPGPVRTDFFDRAGLGGKPTSSPMAMNTDVVVNQILNAFSKGKSILVPGLLNKLLALSVSPYPLPLVTRISRWILSSWRQ